MRSRTQSVPAARLGIKKPPRKNPGRLENETGDLLGDVTGDELGHLEHRDGLLATENDLQLVIGIDLGADLLVLQTIFLDVRPELLGELSAWEWGCTNDGRESGVWRDRFHERCVWFTCCFFSHNVTFVGI